MKDRLYFGLGGVSRLLCPGPCGGASPSVAGGRRRATENRPDLPGWPAPMTSFCLSADGRRVPRPWPPSGRWTPSVLSKENQLSTKERAREGFAFLSFGTRPVPQTWTGGVAAPHGAGGSFLRWPQPGVSRHVELSPSWFQRPGAQRERVRWTLGLAPWASQPRKAALPGGPHVVSPRLLEFSEAMRMLCFPIIAGS